MRMLFFFLLRIVIRLSSSSYSVEMKITLYQLNVNSCIIFSLKSTEILVNFLTAQLIFHAVFTYSSEWKWKLRSLINSINNHHISVAKQNKSALADILHTFCSLKIYLPIISYERFQSTYQQCWFSFVAIQIPICFFFPLRESFASQNELLNDRRFSYYACILLQTLKSWIF